MNMKSIAEADTPHPSAEWCALSDLQRLDTIKENSSSYHDVLEPIEARANGQVIVTLLNELVPGERGTLLLDYEFHLKNLVDSAINVWLKPIGDKNTLRKLRGIEVKYE